LLNEEIKRIFRPSDGQTTLIITVGNTLRSDDGIGPYIAEGINKDLKDLILLNTGDKPENVIDQAMALHPGKTIIIDAADFRGKGGEIRLIPNDLIPQNSLSTHTFPLQVVAQLIEEDTGSKVYFIGIQPENVGLGEGLSPSVKEAGDSIIFFINSNYLME